MKMQANLDNVTIVLKGPKFPGNVGSAARCAMNMGIGKLIVVGNRDLDDEAVRQMATHESKEIVDGIRHFDTLDEALAEFSWVVGTTARQGSGRGPVVSPRRMAEIAGRPLAGKRDRPPLRSGGHGAHQRRPPLLPDRRDDPDGGVQIPEPLPRGDDRLLRAPRRPAGRGGEVRAETGQFAGARGDVHPAQGDPPGDRLSATRRTPTTG